MWFRSKKEKSASESGILPQEIAAAERDEAAAGGDAPALRAELTTETTVAPDGEETESLLAEPHPGVLRTRDLVKRYGRRTVANQVSIEVTQGEIVGLLGPNGAGKTTTFYMTTGLITPNAGKIYLDDKDITSLPVYRRAQLGIGYLAQEASVFRKLSVEDNIRAVLEMTDMTRQEQHEKLESLIEEFSLQKVRKNLGDRLSGGERRRTEIARAVAINPAFILLDEPFAGVDPIAVEDIQSIVATLKHKNIGVIITDHNVDETLAITDRTYLLYEGKILKTGSAEELAADPMVRKVYLGQNFELKRSHQLTQEMKNRGGRE